MRKGQPSDDEGPLGSGLPGDGRSAPEIQCAVFSRTYLRMGSFNSPIGEMITDEAEIGRFLVLCDA